MRSEREATADTVEGVGGASLGYVPAFDGLRALAIALVVAFHFNLAGVPFRKAGYLGVDIFFVLSGFLITTLLLDAHRQHGVSLRTFYTRRAARLVPMVLVLLALGAIFVLAAPGHGRGHPESVWAFTSVGTFWSNWYMISNHEAAGMLADAWSLAIEVQFYFVWPLLFAALLWARVRLRYIAMLVAMVAIGAALWRAHVWSTAPGQVPSTAAEFDRYVVGFRRGEVWRDWYYGSFTHIDGLFIGALAALVVSTARGRAALANRPRFAVALLSCSLAAAAAVLIGAGSSAYAEFVPMWGLLALEVSVAVVIACVVVHPSAPVGTMLAAPPLVWVGRRSYGVYILHLAVFWFLIQFEVGRIFGSMERRAESWIAVAVTVGAAAIAYRYIERPAIAIGRRITRR